MAHPTKMGLDNFPHDTHTNEDTALALVEAEFGLQAYAVYFKLLEAVYSQGYAIPWGADECLLFAKKIGAASVLSRISEIIKGLVRRSLFDERVLNSFQILTSRSIQQRWLQAKRKQISDIDPKVCLIEPTAKVISSPLQRISSQKQGVNSAKTLINSAKTPVFTAENPVISELIPERKETERRKRKEPKEKEERERKEGATSSPNVEEVRQLPDAPPSEEEEENEKSNKEDLNLQAFVKFFNHTMDKNGAQIPRIRSISPDSKRFAALFARLREYSKEDLAGAIRKAAKSNFLNGAGDKAFVANFDWIFRPNNFPKVLEGNYDNHTPQTTSLTTHDTTSKSIEDNKARQRERNAAITAHLHKLAFGTE